MIPLMEGVTYEAFYPRLCRGSSYVGRRRHSDQSCAPPEPAELHNCRTDATVHAGDEVGPPFNGDCDLSSCRRRNYLDLPLTPLAAINRRRRGARDVSPCAHRDLEQISGVVSPDVSPDDCSGGAGGCVVATARK